MTRPDSPTSTSNELLVLHALRCIGFACLDRVAEATGLPRSEVESELIDLAVAGFVTHEAGDFGGWGLTAAGRAADAERIADELDRAGARTAITEAYEDFLVLNPELLDLCTAWQTRTVDGVMTVNDHDDHAYDARVLDRFVELDQRVDGVLADLSAKISRFHRYRIRLTDALDRVRSGALDYVTDSLASYHSVWFQLHEDLLATLGIPRR